MEPNDDSAETVTKPRRSRQPKAERRIQVYRMTDGKRKEQGTFPETVIGDPFERRLSPFISEMFGPGSYKIDVRSTKGTFENSFEIEIGESEPESDQNIIDVEPDINDDVYDDDAGGAAYAVNGHLPATVAEMENLLLKERLRSMEENQSKRPGGSSETDVLIAALKESHREQRDLMMLMLNNAQKPQQDPTALAMTMLENSFGMISKARTLTDEIAPADRSGDDSFLGNAARVVESVGKAAPAFMPMISSLLGGGAAASRVTTPARPAAPQGNADNAAPAPASEVRTGELSDLAGKIKQKDGKK